MLKTKVLTESPTQSARRAATDRGEIFFHPNLIPTHKRYPVMFTHGQGRWLFDEKGRRYLDMLAGIAVDSVGHAHPHLVEAIAGQAAKLIHVSNNFHIDVQERLAERIAALTNMEQVYFANSGAEANEGAIKLARLYGHKNGRTDPHIVVMSRAFHGRTLATLWASGNKKVQDGFGPPIQGFVRVEYGDLAALETVLAQDKQITAVLIEVIQGEGGINLLDTATIEAIGALCERHRVLFMIDEVQTGIGRTGRPFGFQHARVTPDVITLAKGLGGGVPIGALVTARRAVGVIGVGNHGSTFGGNPLACAAGNAVLDILEKEGLCENARSVGEYLMTELPQRLTRFGVKEVRGKGLLIGVQMDRPCADFTRTALEAGLVLSVTADSVIRLVPPLSITRDEAERGIELLGTALQQFSRQ